MRFPISFRSATKGLSQTRPREIAAVVVMGVSGSGKSTVGRALADRLQCEFVDGDDLHPPANVAKMHSGQPLDDADRAPWLAAIAARIGAWIADGRLGVITCSALKRRYRDAIVGGRRAVRLVYLEGSQNLIAGRLADRPGHFMPASLLASQFDALEPPTLTESAISMRIDKTVAAIVDDIVTALSLPAASIKEPA